MLFSVEDKKIVNVWHKEDYEMCVKRLSVEQHLAIEKTLNDYIDNPRHPDNVLDDSVDGKRRVLTSSWVPGKDWTNTVFQAIYEDGCLSNKDASAKCFGLILQKVIMDRPEKWMFMKAEMSDGNKFRGTTYWYNLPDD